MFARFLFALVVILSCGSLAFSQKPGGGGSNGGGNTGGSTGGGLGQPNLTIPTFSQPAELQVRLSWPDERRLEESIHVQLLSSSNIPVQDMFSQQDGSVTFHAIPVGSYRLKLDGPDIQEMVTEPFIINTNERMHMEWVHVIPKQQADNNKNVPGAPPTISATELNVPSKAKDEMNKGMDAFSKGDLKKADEKLQSAVAIYPKYARAWNNLGVVRMKENNQEGARDAFQQCVEADDKFTPGYMNLARISMLNKNMPQAVEYINKGLSNDPNNVEGLSLLAKEQLLTGEYDKALANAHRVHTLPHDHLADVHLIAGEALLHQNRNTEAVQEFEQYLKEYPDSPNAATVRRAMAQIQAKQTKTN